MSNRPTPPVLGRVGRWFRGDGLLGFEGVTRRWFCRLEWKPQDLWVGVFWKRDYPWQLDVWVCIVPMVPIHFGWEAQVAHG